MIEIIDSKYKVILLVQIKKVKYVGDQLHKNKINLQMSWLLQNMAWKIAFANTMTFPWNLFLLMSQLLSDSHTLPIRPFSNSSKPLSKAQFTSIVFSNQRGML